MTVGKELLVGTSWKMHKTRPEAVAWVEEVAAGLQDLPRWLRVFVMPPFTALESVVRAAQGTPLLVGAQNVHEEEQGAFTGEVSAGMLSEVGCEMVELGHSERRALFNETDAAVGRKVRRVLEHRMTPLVCVGETAKQRADGSGVAAVVQQAQHALAGLRPSGQARCLLAYEPAWAIGEGATPARPDQIEPVHAALQAQFPATLALYGGSVSQENASQIVATAGVSGLFVGRAALTAQGFLAVLATACPPPFHANA